MTNEDLEKTSRDLRVGMGIGGWDMEHTYHHIPTGCKIVFQTHGSYPPHYKMRDEVLALLEMLVEKYEDSR